MIGWQFPVTINSKITNLKKKIGMNECQIKVNKTIWYLERGAKGYHDESKKNSHVTYTNSISPILVVYYGKTLYLTFPHLSVKLMHHIN